MNADLLGGRVLLLLLFFISVTDISAQRLPDLIPYRKGNLWGYCDSTKRMVIEPRFERAFFFKNGVAIVRSQGEKFWLNTDASLSNFCSGGDEYREFIGPDGAQLLSEADTMHYFGEWIPSLIRKDSCIDHDDVGEIQICWHGLTNSKGRLILSTSYDQIGNFFDGRSVICLQGKYGFIDTEGNTIRAPVYDLLCFPWHFVNGFIFAERIEGSTFKMLGYIDKYGTEYWED
jgi:hypothetical protein